MGFLEDNLLSNETKQKLHRSIERVEAKSTAELVTVVTQRSDDYRYICIMWSALAALALPGFWFIFNHLIGDTSALQWSASGAELATNIETVNDAQASGFSAKVYAWQVTLFSGLLMLFIWAPFRLKLIPTAIKQKRSADFAQAQFRRYITESMAATPQTSATTTSLHYLHDIPVVMLFVSIEEHYVELIANPAAAQKIDNTVWDLIIIDFIENFRRQDISGGFEQAISQTGQILCEHFPSPGEASTLSDNRQNAMGQWTNRLIVIPENLF